MGLRVQAMPIQVPLPDGHLELLQWSLPGLVQELGIHPFDLVFPSCVLQQELRVSPRGDVLTLLLVLGPTYSPTAPIIGVTGSTSPLPSPAISGSVIDGGSWPA